MKTTSFCTIAIDYGEDNEAILKVSSPMDGSVTITLTGDELLMFLVEVGNGLQEVRHKEIAAIVANELEKEQRRV